MWELYRNEEYRTEYEPGQLYDVCVQVPAALWLYGSQRAASDQLRHTTRRSTYAGGIRLVQPYAPNTVWLLSLAPKPLHALVCFHVGKPRAFPQLDGTLCSRVAAAAQLF